MWKHSWLEALRISFLISLANQNKLKESIKDLTLAVKIDKNHKNAANYLKIMTEREETARLKDLEVKQSLIAGEYILVRILIMINIKLLQNQK